jgi:hypothetical protein
MTGFNPSWITHYRGKLSALWKGRYALGRTADPDRYFVLSEAISGLFDELLTAQGGRPRPESQRNRCNPAAAAVSNQLVPGGVIIRGSSVAGGAVSLDALTMPSGLRLGWEP